MASSKHVATEDVSDFVTSYRPSRKWRSWTVSLRCVASFFAAIAAIIFLVLGAQSDQLYNYDRYYRMTWDIVSLPIVFCCLAWNVAEFITLSVRKTAGIHPGAHIALDFCLFGALLGGGVTSIFLWLDSRPAGMAAASLTILTSLFHLVLFILDCIEVDRRRKDLIKQLVLLREDGNNNNGSAVPSGTLNIVAGPTHPPTAQMVGFPPDTPLSIEHNGIVYYAVPPTTAALLQQRQQRASSQRPPTYVKNDAAEAELDEKA